VKGEFIGCLLIFEDISSEKRLKGTLARYMTKEVADQLLSNADAMLGGQLKQATILFSDIRSFTSISERTGPQETVSMLNEYFTVMVDILFNHGGILDKYIGDALLAVFGAPFSTGRDADQALCAAIEMMRALREFNIRRAHENKHPINVGIGINTDEVLVGNIGSMKRMDYTVIGDGVNLASRLESATKYYNVNIIISGYTRQILADKYLLREIDLIRVKGKTKPVAIYEVLDFHDETTFPHAEEIVCVFDEALAAYRCADWKGALKKLERALYLHPGDKTAHLYVERCRRLLTNPPPMPWDGVWVMTEK
jgi:adenylate cyclase